MDMFRVWWWIFIGISIVWVIVKGGLGYFGWSWVKCKFS